MSILGPIWTPLRALLFALGGAALAWAWFNVGWLVPVAIVMGAWIVTAVVQWFAESLITTKPLTALTLFEFRLFGIIMVSAGAASLVIIVTVWFTLDDEQKKVLTTSTQEVIGAVGAALTAFIAAVAVSAESADENVGDLVKKKFRAKYVVDENPGSGQKAISTDTDAGKRADRALNSSNDYGWADWSSDYRRARVEAIHSYLNPQT